ncbi:hypothetical protein LCGC14_3021900, partial [marine sediment metagenome]
MLIPLYPFPVIPTIPNIPNPKRQKLPPTTVAPNLHVPFTTSPEKSMVALVVSRVFVYILSTTEGRILLAEEDEFEVLEPSTFIPTAGDQVIVTNIFVTNDIVGHKFSVIKSRMCPDELSDISKCIWCT